MLGEALDGYLERLGDCNGFTRTELIRNVRGADDDPIIFLPLIVIPRVAERISILTGFPADIFTNMTFSGWTQHLPLNVHTSEEPSAKDKFTLQKQGWFPGHGTQYCPECLREERVWQLKWRLPLMFACTRHHTLLRDACPGCNKPPRSIRGFIFRTHLDRPTECGNVVANGQYCRYDLASTPKLHATVNDVKVTIKLESVFTSQPAAIFGEHASAVTYLKELKSTATLLCYLATNPSNPHPCEPKWCHDLRTEHESRRQHSQPRWHISPPMSSQIRARLLATSDEILSSPSIDIAAARFEPWLARLPDGTNPRRQWLLDRSQASESVSKLFTESISPRRRLGHLLDDEEPVQLTYKQLPQQIPVNVYREHMAPALHTSESIGRAFTSLCLARRLPDVRTWAQAGAVLGIPKTRALKLCRAAQARMLSTPFELSRILHNVAATLDTSTDWRAKEVHIAALTDEAGSWTRQWSIDHCPEANSASWANALTWRWEHEALGLPETSPAWSQPVTKSQLSEYRAFAAMVNTHLSTRREFRGKRKYEVTAIPVDSEELASPSGELCSTQSITSDTLFKGEDMRRTPASATRKTFQWPTEFTTEISHKRITWHTEDPYRIETLSGLVSESAFVRGLVTMALEDIDYPSKSQQLWDIIQRQR